MDVFWAGCPHLLHRMKTGSRHNEMETRQKTDRMQWASRRDLVSDFGQVFSRYVETSLSTQLSGLEKGFAMAQRKYQRAQFAWSEHWDISGKPDKLAVDDEYSRSSQTASHTLSWQNESCRTQSVYKSISPIKAMSSAKSIKNQPRILRSKYDTVRDRVKEA
jgi:hypothetical protein